MAKDWRDSVTKFGFPYTKKEAKERVKKTVVGFTITIIVTALFCLLFLSGNQGVMSAVMLGFCGIEFIIGVFVVLCIWANRKK
ncbi:hypothetical protein IKX12_03335 [Candidatus Saccharibacteria bacterium]|nr:hypothetical protein [Candidatus Saccharibacteria bacterium]